MNKDIKCILCNTPCLLDVKTSENIKTHELYSKNIQIDVRVNQKLPYTLFSQNYNLCQNCFETTGLFNLLTKVLIIKDNGLRK